MSFSLFRPRVVRPASGNAVAGTPDRATTRSAAPCTRTRHGSAPAVLGVYAAIGGRGTGTAGGAATSTDGAAGEASGGGGTAGPAVGSIDGRSRGAATGAVTDGAATGAAGWNGDGTMVAGPAWVRSSSNASIAFATSRTSRTTA